MKYTERGMGAFRDYHPDYFRVQALARAYSALNTTAFVFLAALLVLPVVGLVALNLLPWVALGFGIAYLITGIFAAIDSAEALEWPKWLMVGLHLVTLGALLLNALLLMALVSTMRTKLKEFGVRLGSVGVNPEDLAVLERRLIRYR